MPTYTEALAYLNQFISYERQQPLKYSPETLNLDRVHALLDRLGRPDRQVRTIHIAWTKGKGSTAAMIESCLRACSRPRAPAGPWAAWFPLLRGTRS